MLMSPKKQLIKSKIQSRSFLIRRSRNEKHKQLFLSIQFGGLRTMNIHKPLAFIVKRDRRLPLQEKNYHNVEKDNNKIEEL